MSYDVKKIKQTQSLVSACCVVPQCNQCKLTTTTWTHTDTRTTIRRKENRARTPCTLKHQQHHDNQTQGDTIMITSNRSLGSSCILSVPKTLHWTAWRNKHREALIHRAHLRDHAANACHLVHPIINLRQRGPRPKHYHNRQQAGGHSHHRNTQKRKKRPRYIGNIYNSSTAVYLRDDTDRDPVGSSLRLQHGDNDIVPVFRASSKRRHKPESRRLPLIVITTSKLCTYSYMHRQRRVLPEKADDKNRNPPVHTEKRIAPHPPLCPTTLDSRV